MTKQTQGAVDALALNVSSADANLDRIARGFYIGTQGNISLVTLAGNTVLFKNVQGELNVQSKRVLNANTTATDIIALF